MAKIRDGKEGRQDGAYYRIFGDKKLGALISRIHATSIRAGTELENIIGDRVNLINDLDEFLDRDKMSEGAFVAPKKEIKRSTRINFDGSEPDFLIFKRTGVKKHCYVVELKDGDAFDTKKAAGEMNSMRAFLSNNAPQIPYTVSIHFCCFNQSSKEAIVNGFKRKISSKEAMTGTEFCDLMGLDYNEIVRTRKAHQKDNLDYFLTSIIALHDKRIRKLLK